MGAVAAAMLANICRVVHNQPDFLDHPSFSSRTVDAFAALLNNSTKDAARCSCISVLDVLRACGPDFVSDAHCKAITTSFGDSVAPQIFSLAVVLHAFGTNPSMVFLFPRQVSGTVLPSIMSALYVYCCIRDGVADVSVWQTMGALTLQLIADLIEIAENDALWVPRVEKKRLFVVVVHFLTSKDPAVRRQALRVIQTLSRAYGSDVNSELNDIADQFERQSAN